VAQIHSLHALLPIVAMTVAACAGAQPKQTGEENNFETTPNGESSPSGSEVSSTPEEGEGLNSDQKKQMEIALRRGGDKAANCTEVVADAPAGEGEVKVVFDGQKGRVTDVLVGPPFAGTPAEGCIKRAFVGEIVLPFDGEPLEVPYSVKLPPKKGAAPAPDKKK